MQSRGVETTPGTTMSIARNCPGTPAKRGLQAVLSRKNIFDARKVAHSPPYRGVPGHARGGTWAVTKAEAALEGALKQREADPAEGQLAAAMQRLGELSMENELLRAKMERSSP